MTRTKTRANANMPHTIVSVLDYGAVPHDPSHGNDVAIANRTAIQECLNANNSSTIIDFAGEEYRISGGPLVWNNVGGSTLQNGAIIQLDIYENTLELTGGYASRVSLLDFSLSHSQTLTQADVDAYNAANPSDDDPKLGFDVGNNLYVRVNNFPWFRWVGGSCNNGYHAMYSYGTMWMGHIERIWSLSPFHSGFYLAASGGVADNVQRGGSTTTKLYKCFVTDVQLDTPAYQIGAGFDTLILENCSADRVCRFGFFKASPVHIINCSTEQLRPFNNPGNLNPFTAPQYVMELQSGCAATVDGFHIVDDGSQFTTPPSGTVNCFIYTLNAAPLTLLNIRGGLPAGFYMLNQEGGESFLNTNEIGNGVRTIYDAVCKRAQDIGEFDVTYNRKTGSIDGSGKTELWTVEQGTNTYTLTTNWAYQGAWNHTCWILSTYSNGVDVHKMMIENLLDGPDQAGKCTVTLDDDKVVFNAGFNLYGSWQAFNYNPSSSTFRSVENLIADGEITDYSI